MCVSIDLESTPSLCLASTTAMPFVLRSKERTTPSRSRWKILNTSSPDTRSKSLTSATRTSASWDPTSPLNLHDATANDGASVATSLQNSSSSFSSFGVFPTDAQLRSSGVMRTPRSARRARSSRARIFVPTSVSSSRTGTLRNTHHPAPTSISKPAPAKRSFLGTTDTVHASPDADGRTPHEVYGMYSERLCSKDKCPSLTVVYVNMPFSTRTLLTPSVRHRAPDSSHQPTRGSGSDRTRSSESRYDTVTGGASRSMESNDFGAEPVAGMGYGTRRTFVVSGVTARKVQSLTTSGSGGKVRRSKVRMPPMDSTGPRGFVSATTGSGSGSTGASSTGASSPESSSVGFVSPSTPSSSGFVSAGSVSVSVCAGAAFSFSSSSFAGSSADASSVAS
mmetsp:Transcript_1806/g.7479  ORF Transcript_1806/g.7479 Transcript_1806/m.7479 type:complete len:394 (-) Transcript_1806:997-2178(-)